MDRNILSHLWDTLAAAPEVEAAFGRPAAGINGAVWIDSPPPRPTLPLAILSCEEGQPVVMVLALRSDEVISLAEVARKALKVDGRFEPAPIGRAERIDEPRLEPPLFWKVAFAVTPRE